MQNDENETCALPFGGAQIDFPQKFDLRIIYSLADGGTVRADLASILAANSVVCSGMSDIPTKPGRYARLAASVEFASLAQMRTVYESVGRLPCVKALF